MKEQVIPISTIDLEENKKKIPGTGVVLGKFYPPHAGHDHLIETALEKSESVEVIVVDRPNQTIPGKLRAQWISENHPVFTRVLKDDGFPEWDPEFWAKITIQTLKYIPEFVFTSEDYGERWANNMGSTHVLVDPGRNLIPISGTQVRANPEENLHNLKPNVKKYYEENR